MGSEVGQTGLNAAPNRILAKQCNNFLFICHGIRGSHEVTNVGHDLTLHGYRSIARHAVP
jgi:hypothetical protein